MSAILQGTNPEIRIDISTSDYLVSDITKLRVVFINERVVTTHDLDEVTLDTETNSIIYQTTEEETFNFSSKSCLYVRTRALLSNGRLVGTKKCPITIEENEDKELMTT